MRNITSQVPPVLTAAVCLPELAAGAGHRLARPVQLGPPQAGSCGSAHGLVHVARLTGWVCAARPAGWFLWLGSWAGPCGSACRLGLSASRCCFCALCLGCTAPASIIVWTEKCCPVFALVFKSGMNFHVYMKVERLDFKAAEKSRGSSQEDWSARHACGLPSWPVTLWPPLFFLCVLCWRCKDVEPCPWSWRELGQDPALSAMPMAVPCQLFNLAEPPFCHLKDLMGCWEREICMQFPRGKILPRRCCS